MNDEPNPFGAGDAAMTSSVTVSVIGRLRGKPEIRQTKDGRDFATATVIVNAKPGQPSYFRALAFGDETRDELACAREGCIVSVQGALDLSLWENKDGEKQISVSVFASRVMCLELTPIKNDRSPASVASKRVTSSTPTKGRNATPSDDDDTDF